MRTTHKDDDKYNHHHDTREQRADTWKAAARTDGLSGLESGFTKLDKMTSGWQNSDLIIIAARPAMGKTAFFLSMAKNLSLIHI